MKNKFQKLNFKIRAVGENDRGWVKKFIKKEWRSEKIISRGKIYYPHKLPGSIALKGKKYLGLITYNIKGKDCEIISLNSSVKGKGVGTSLVKEVKRIAKKSGCEKLRLTTTNDNINALCFWQKNGFSLKAIYPNVVSKYRKLKPEIPKIGNYGIPIKDEIEFELKIR